MTQAVAARAAKPREPLRFNKPSMLGVGTMVWLGSELMFFSGLFAAYFTIRANRTGSWPPPGIKLDVLQTGIFTIILVLSSFTMQKAVFEAEHYRKRSARAWIVLTMIMGLAFLGNQAIEWSRVTFSQSTNAYGSMFFIMTGLHGLHVLLGVVAMAFLMLRLAGKKTDPGELAALQSVSYYWHFVDVVWIALYGVLFLLH